MTLGDSFSALFGSINIFTVCLWTVGLTLFCIEFFQPMRGVAYVLGSAAMCAAFVTRMLYGSAGEAYVFVLMTAVLIFAVHIVALGTQKRDWLRVARIEKAGERSRKFGNLIDKIGVATTDIDLTGSVTINDVNLVVYSDSRIAAGEKVRIVRVSHDRITVGRVDASDEVSQ
ncbi:MAG: hypothetical protein NC184_00245 [Roseburia sp.]|nr:hypothetical protein [Roseburia sp.]